MIVVGLVAGCFSTKETKHCKSFDLYIGPVSMAGNVLFSDAVSFNEHMDRFLAPSELIKEMNCDPKSTFKETIEERRYYYCAYYAGASSQCDDQNKDKPALCQSTCLDYSKKIQETMFPNNGCIEQQVGIRQSTLDLIKNSCTKPTLTQYKYLGSQSNCVGLAANDSLSAPTTDKTNIASEPVPIYGWVLISIGILAIIGAIWYFVYKLKRKRIMSLYPKIPVIETQITPKTIITKQIESSHSLEGKNVLVTYPYNASMDDELVLNVGDLLRVNIEYGDGWLLGYNHTTHQEGIFPAACIEQHKTK